MGGNDYTFLPYDFTSPIIGANGEPLQGPGTAFTPLHSILAPLNYGEVTMAGVDVGLTYFLRQYQLTFDTNFSFTSITSIMLISVFGRKSTPSSNFIHLYLV